MPNRLLSDEARCTSTLDNGRRCGAPHVEHSDKCLNHDPKCLEERQLRIERERAARAAAPFTPDLSLDQIAHLDLRSADGITLARTGVWQHLLAGTLPPHVGKPALDVAERINSSTLAPKHDALASTIAAVIAKPPPKLDD